MEVGHNNKTANYCNYTPELDLVVTLNAASEIICYSAVKFYHEEACNCDGDTAKEPAPAKCPLHKRIISQLGLAWIEII